MKALLKKLLCSLFIHDFHTLDSGNGITLIGCHRCAGRWQVDTRNREMEPVEEGQLGQPNLP